MTVVLDASMAIAWLFDDERTQAAHRVMLRIAGAGAVVPAHWRLEVANVLKNAVRRGRCREDYADRSLDRLGRLSIAVDRDTDSQAWGTTLGLARGLDLTLYDAAYLELSLRAGMPLASCDTALIAAAKRKGVEVLTA
jgi:predicted nucleic acid-binding protein